ncbi:MAG: RluA family pseudouridine synthase [Clostridia bacterium]|nr:RluA family pseudouridine synthase [Clostridia bacterium]
MIRRVGEDAAGMRLDAFLAREDGDDSPALSRSAAAKLIEAGGVTLNGRPADKKDRVTPGDLVEYALPEPEPIDAQPEDLPLDVVYEDRDLLVINKPSGMVVHPAPGNPSGTLVNALLYHCRGELSGINGALRPGIVHRIDKQTSGLLVVAKNDETHRRLAAELEGHHITREYHALVQGGFSSDTGTIDLPIGRHPVDRKKMAVIRGGHTSRPAVTHYTVAERFGDVTYLILKLETGRTHQIRVHLSSIGHPLLGDTTYGGGKTPFERRHANLFDGQCLHAARLTFIHPATGEEMTFTCPLPPDFTALLGILRRERGEAEADDGGKV